MIFDIALLILFGLIADLVFRKLRMPGLVGMLLLGVILGPYVLDLLAPDFLSVSSDLRMIALIVILLRAGFELSKDTLNRLGLRILLLSFIPAVFEGVAITFLGHYFLGLSMMESAIIGAVISAVSPAVVVPMMIRFIEERKGTKKGIPTLILAASSIDDVFVIVIYSILIGLYTSQNVNIVRQLGGIPISIISGIAAGLACGFVLYKIFDRFNPRATKRLLIILGTAMVLVNLEKVLENILPFASLLAVMAVGFIILEKNEYMAHEISSKLAKVWVFAEIVLFVLVGAQVNLHVLVSSGLAGAAVILIGLVARSAGTYCCLFGSDMTFPERMFVVISYLPKATVQAAIGGAPLIVMRAYGMDTKPGEVILATAVLSIVLTAPAGAWAIKYLGDRVLAREKPRSLEDGSDTRVSRESILSSFKVLDVMEKDIVIIKEKERVSRVISHFSTENFLTYPVIDSNKKLTGMISLTDLKTILQEHHTWEWLVAKDVAVPVEISVYTSSTLKEALDEADKAGLEQVPVVEKRSDKVVGILDVRNVNKFIEQKIIASI